MNKLLILQGIPASGKSTWAREFISKDNNSKKWIIVNRDSIRSMLGEYWVPTREDLVSEIEKYTIETALLRDYNVIVEDCYDKTVTWIKQHILPDVILGDDIELFMRLESDHRKDAIIKKEFYDSDIKDKYDVYFVLDDRKQVVDMWRKECELTVLQVAEGDF